MNVRIKKEIIELYIELYAQDIQSMDEKTLPAVMFELQSEELVYRGIDFSKEVALKINEFSEETIEKIFYCWMSSDEGLDWYQEMLEAQEKELIKN